jgi:hypothetical protein
MEPRCCLEDGLEAWSLVGHDRWGSSVLLSPSGSPAPGSVTRSNALQGRVADHIAQLLQRSGAEVAAGVDSCFLPFDEDAQATVAPCAPEHLGQFVKQRLGDTTPHESDRPALYL